MQSFRNNSMSVFILKYIVFLVHIQGLRIQLE